MLVLAPKVLAGYASSRYAKLFQLYRVAGKRNEALDDAQDIQAAEAAVAALVDSGS